MDNKKKLILVVAVLILGAVSIVTGIGTMTNAGGGGVKYEKYISAEYGFSVNYPHGWIKDNTQGMAVSYSDPGRNAGFNVNVVSAGGKTLSQYVGESKLMWENMSPDINLTNEKSIQVNGGEGHEWTIIWDNFAGSGIKATLKLGIFLANDTAYVITFMVRSEAYDSYAGTFDAILNSFTVP